MAIEWYLSNCREKNNTQGQPAAIVHPEFASKSLFANFTALVCCCFFFLYRGCLKQPCVFTNGSKRRRSETRGRFLPLVRSSLDVCQQNELMWNNTGELRSPGCQVRFWLEAWSHSANKQQQTVLICSARQQVPKRSSVSMKSHIWPLRCEIAVRNNSSSTLNFYHPYFFFALWKQNLYKWNMQICKSWQQAQFRSCTYMT